MRAATIFITSAIAFAAVQPSLAADAPKKGGAAPGTSVDMPYLIAPLSSPDALVGYAYISCKIITSSQAAALTVRDRVPFIQDAFVRDVNAATVSKADDPQAVDSPALTARLLADAKKVTKPGAVTGLQLIEVQIRPLHPQPVTTGGPT
jgi:hypothetical protein